MLNIPWIFGLRIRRDTVDWTGTSIILGTSGTIFLGINSSLKTIASSNLEGYFLEYYLLLRFSLPSIVALNSAPSVRAEQMNTLLLL
jgi:hypothetical protein